MVRKSFDDVIDYLNGIDDGFAHFFSEYLKLWKDEAGKARSSLPGEVSNTLISDEE